MCALYFSDELRSVNIFHMNKARNKELPVFIIHFSCNNNKIYSTGFLTAKYKLNKVLSANK